MADLHTGLESYIEGRADYDVARFVRTQLRRSRDDVVYVLHVVPVRAPGPPTLADTLSVLGFTFTKQCPAQKRADCFALEVPSDRSVEDLANHVLTIWGHGQQAAAHLGACGIAFPEPWRCPGLIQALVGRAMQQPQIVEGHEAETHSRRGDAEDDAFRYRLTWIEQRTTRGWVVHYEPKQPLPAETVATLTLLGLRPYAACHMLEFRPSGERSRCHPQRPSTTRALTAYVASSTRTTRTSCRHSTP